MDRVAQVCFRSIDVLDAGPVALDQNQICRSQLIIVELEEEAYVRVITVPMVAALSVLAAAAFAQTDAPKGSPDAPTARPSTGPLPPIDTGTGRVIVEPDGSTKTVKAAPCSTAAHETDGSTTCVGIPDASDSAKKNQ